MTTTVKDIMTTNVYSARAEWTVHKLAEFFFENCVSGAPVIDGDDQLLGVVSLTDLARYDSLDDNNDKRDIATHDVYVRHLESHIAGEELSAFQLEGDSMIMVRSIMTPMVFDVDESTSIQEAADIMIKGHIHRVFVTNNNKVVGVVSAMDMLKVISKLPA